MAAIHSCQVVHRDIKLSNILITPNRTIKIGDFGLAKVIGERDHDVTETGQLIGTVQYMAPELFDGSDCTVQSDIFSLGLLFYMLLCDTNPFLAKTDLDTAKRIRELEVDLPAEIQLDCADSHRSWL